MTPGYRLVTKGDFDGLACGILLKEIGLVREAVFVHPRDVLRGRFAITDGDVTAGVPYRERAHLAFDHSALGGRFKRAEKNHIVDRGAASTARVIHRHYGAGSFPHLHEELLAAVDKGSSARLTSCEILSPNGWTLLDFLIDMRTGLERLGSFRVSHDELMNELIDAGGSRPVTELLSLPDVAERLELYFASVEAHKEQVMRCSTVHRNLVVTDLRGERVLQPGNKFATNALFPECNVTLEVFMSPDGDKVEFAAGRSILDRTCSVDVGAVMRRYGGAGHAWAGECEADPAAAPEVLAGLIDGLRYGLLKNLFQGYFNYY